MSSEWQQGVEVLTLPKTHVEDHAHESASNHTQVLTHTQVQEARLRARRERALHHVKFEL